MLARRETLEGIKRGEITLNFRRSLRRSIRPGVTLTTAVGMVTIADVTVCQLEEITNQEAYRAGFRNRDELIKDLNRRHGQIYRIQLYYSGADPRMVLREDSDLTDEAVRDIIDKLAKLDKSSADGPWTKNTLEIIGRNPTKLNGIMATSFSQTEEVFKIRARRLKNLGLIMSQHPGYELSPRGRRFLKLWKERGDGE